MRRLMGVIATVVLAVMASFTFGQVAGAQYAPTVCTVTVSPTTVAAGDTVTLSGTLSNADGPVTPGSQVTFSINGAEIGTASTEGDGSFSVQVTIPADLAAGTYTIVADCGGGVLGDTEVGVTDGTNPPSTNPPGTNPPGTNPPGTNPPGTGPGGNNQGGGSQGGGSQGGGSQGGGSLARTGTDLGLPVQIGIGLLALGGIILALSASRRRTSAA